MIRTAVEVVRTAALVAVALLAAACHHHDDGSSAPTPPPVTVAAPTIATSPANATVAAGQTATFSVVASGAGPFTYQWRRGGTAIAGATGSSYTTPATVAADDGATFDVVVSNAGGSVTSAAATLRVAAAAPTVTFTQQPTAATVAVGATATFTVAATCSDSSSPAFQWQRSGDAGATWANVGGATAATFALTATAADDGARFRAQVTCGTSTQSTNAATLAVAPAAAAANVCSGASGRGWCWVAPGPQGNRLTRVRFDDASNGFAIGWQGTWIRSTDGGRAWSGTTPLPVFGNAVFNLADVARVDATTIVAVGDATVIRSTDNGATWSKVSVPLLPADSNPLHYAYNAVAFSGTTGYATAQLNTGAVMLIKSGDGGATWSVVNSFPVPSPNVLPLSTIRFGANAQTVYVAGSRFYKSTDGGASWAFSTLTGATNGVWDMSWVDANVGVIVGTDGIFRTTNGGTTWSLVNSDFRFNGVHMRADGVGLAVGGSNFIYRTTDGGATWTVISGFANRLATNLTDVRWLDAQTAVAVGWAGRILRSTDAGLTWQRITSGFSPDDVDPGFNDVHFGNSQVGVAVGGIGVLRTTDGGASWQPVAQFAGKVAVGVAFADANTAVLMEPGSVSPQMIFWRTTDGGVTWQIADGGAVKDLRFTNGGVGVAVGVGGLIMRTANAGATWTTIQTSTFGAPDLNAVRWAGATTAVAVGQDGTLVRTTDAGLTWTAVTGFPSTMSFSSLAFSSATNGIALADDRLQNAFDRHVFLRTSDGGATWSAPVQWSTALGTGTSVHLLPERIVFADSQVGLVVGSYSLTLPDPSGATMIRTTDGGATWSLEPSPYVFALHGVYFPSPSVGVVVGDGASVLRTTTAGAR